MEIIKFLLMVVLELVEDDGMNVEKVLIVDVFVLCVMYVVCEIVRDFIGDYSLRAYVIVVVFVYVVFSFV